VSLSIAVNPLLGVVASYVLQLVVLSLGFPNRKLIVTPNTLKSIDFLMGLVYKFRRVRTRLSRFRSEGNVSEHGFEHDRPERGEFIVIYQRLGYVL